MKKNPLIVVGTGLDHLYLNGIPIVELEVDMSEVYKKVARISSLAVQADPYFNDKSNAQKLFSESHGEGDRITRDFLEEGAKELLPIFSPFQRLIPAGAYDTTPVVYEELGNVSDLMWTNTDPSSTNVNSVEIIAKDGSATNVELYINSSILISTFDIPDSNSFTKVFNLRDYYPISEIAFLVNVASPDFEYDVKINGVKYDAIGWIKALTEAGNVHIPGYNDDIKISNLIEGFSWEKVNPFATVLGAVIKQNVGSSYVTISYNGVAGTEKFIDENTKGDDFFDVTDDISTISVELRDPSDDFNYDLIINTEIPNIIPSPRFEFDSAWNEGKIIFRYQNMDTRSLSQKLNYTSLTLRDVRVDTNTYDEVLKYITDALKNYVLKELYLAVGYDKKANEYFSKYEQSRRDAKFWLRSEKGLQTQYHYAGV